jgi:hypothetical protein
MSDGAGPRPDERRGPRRFVRPTLMMRIADGRASLLTEEVRLGPECGGEPPTLAAEVRDMFYYEPEEITFGMRCVTPRQ